MCVNSSFVDKNFPCVERTPAGVSRSIERDWGLIASKGGGVNGEGEGLWISSHICVNSSLVDKNFVGSWVQILTTSMDRASRLGESARWMVERLSSS